MPRRIVSGATAAAVAFGAFILGLVLLFDRVGATKGHSTTAWVVSIAGLIGSLIMGLLIGVALLRLAVMRSETARSTTAFFARLALGEAALVILLCVVFVRLD